MANPDNILKELESAKRKRVSPEKMEMGVTNGYQDYLKMRKRDPSMTRKAAFDEVVKKNELQGRSIRQLQETIEINDVGIRVGNAQGEYEAKRRTDPSRAHDEVFDEVAKKYDLEQGTGFKALQDSISAAANLPKPDLDDRGKLGRDGGGGAQTDNVEEEQIRKIKEEERNRAREYLGSRYETIPEIKEPRGRWWKGPDDSALVLRGSGVIWKITSGKSYNFGISNAPMWKTWKGAAEGWIDTARDDIESASKENVEVMRVVETRPVDTADVTIEPADVSLTRTEPVSDAQPEGDVKYILSRRFIKKGKEFTHVSLRGKWNIVNVGQNYGATNDEGIDGNIQFREGRKEYDFVLKKERDRAEPASPTPVDQPIEPALSPAEKMRARGRVRKVPGLRKSAAPSPAADEAALRDHVVNRRSEGLDAQDSIESQLEQAIMVAQRERDDAMLKDKDRVAGQIAEGLNLGDLRDSQAEDDEMLRVLREGVGEARLRSTIDSNAWTGGRRTDENRQGGGLRQFYRWVGGLLGRKHTMEKTPLKEWQDEAEQAFPGAGERHRAAQRAIFESRGKRFSEAQKLGLAKQLFEKSKHWSQMSFKKRFGISAVLIGGGVLISAGAPVFLPAYGVAAFGWRAFGSVIAGASAGAAIEKHMMEKNYSPEHAREAGFFVFGSTALLVFVGGLALAPAIEAGGQKVKQALGPAAQWVSDRIMAGDAKIRVSDGVGTSGSKIPVAGLEDAKKPTIRMVNGPNTGGEFISPDRTEVSGALPAKPWAGPVDIVVGQNVPTGRFGIDGLRDQFFGTGGMFAGANLQPPAQEQLFDALRRTLAGNQELANTFLTRVNGGNALVRGGDLFVNAGDVMHLKDAFTNPEFLTELKKNILQYEKSYLTPALGNKAGLDSFINSLPSVFKK